MPLETFPEIQAFLVSILPIAGIRVSIPFAVTVLELSWQSAFLISIAGGVFAMFMIFTFLEWVTEFLRKYFRIFEIIIDYIFEKTRREKKESVEKYGYFALAGFTAVPLPFSGVWTASLVAYLFGLNYRKSVLSIFFGALVSAIIVTAVTVTGETITTNGGLRLVGLFFLIAIFYYYLFFNKKEEKHE